MHVADVILNVEELNVEGSQAIKLTKRHIPVPTNSVLLVDEQPLGRSWRADID